MENEMQTLYETVMDRKANPEEGSYTAYLFEKGDEKILKKVGEECTEVIIAALSQSREDLIGEVSDLFYHVMVLLAQKDISYSEIEEKLKERSLKKHNLKPERKPIEKY